MRHAGDNVAFLRVHSAISTVLHVLTFAYDAPCLLEEALHATTDRLQLVLQICESATVSDLCTVLSVLDQHAPPVDTKAAERAAVFVSEVTGRVEHYLEPLMKANAISNMFVDAATQNRPLRVKHTVVASLRVLDALISRSTLSDQVRVSTRLACLAVHVTVVLRLRG
jgi:hypothetical protein